MFFFDLVLLRPFSGKTRMEARAGGPRLQREE